MILNVANGRAAFDFDPGMEVDGTKFPATINAKQTGDGSGKSEWYNFENLEPVTAIYDCGIFQLLRHGHKELPQQECTEGTEQVRKKQRRDGVQQSHLLD